MGVAIVYSLILLTYIHSTGNPQTTQTTQTTQATSAQQVIAVSGLQQEGAIAAGPFVISLLSGGNEQNLANQLAEINKKNIKAIVSFGVAGALAPNLAAGSVAVATAVVSADGSRWPTDPTITTYMIKTLRSAHVRVHSGLWFGSADAVAEASQKSALFARTGAIAVDQESQVAAKWAATNGIPLVVLRTISDPQALSVPAFSLSALNADGSLNIGAVFFGLFQDPGDLGNLIATGFDAFDAFSQLQHCRNIVDLGAL